MKVNGLIRNKIKTIQKAAAHMRSRSFSSADNGYYIVQIKTPHIDGCGVC